MKLSVLPWCAIGVKFDWFDLCAVVIAIRVFPNTYGLVPFTR